MKKESKAAERGERLELIFQCVIVRVKLQEWRTTLFGASGGPMPSADGMASVTGMAKPCRSRIRGWHGCVQGQSPSADGPGHPRIIHLIQNRLPCIAKAAS